MSLHPQAKSFLDCLKSRGAPPIHTLTPEENREGSRIMSKRTALPPEPVAAVQERFIPVENGKIKLRIYTPEGKGLSGIYPFLWWRLGYRKYGCCRFAPAGF